MNARAGLSVAFVTAMCIVTTMSSLRTLPAQMTIAAMAPRNQRFSRGTYSRAGIRRA